MTESLISISKLAFCYPKSDSVALAIDAWQLQRGQHTFIQGKSGSGKSTLLNILSGIQKVNDGEVNVLGTNLTELSEKQRDKFRAQHVGIVFQQMNLVPYLTVKDNILLANFFAKKQPAEQEQKISQLLTQLQLPLDLLDKPAENLSVGQQQRVAIARALINQPEIIIADEPTSALDSDARDAFMQVLFNSAKEFGATILFVSHDKSLAEYFDNICLMTELNKQLEVA